MTISATRHSTMCNLVGHDNVFIKESIATNWSGKIQTQADLYEVIAPLLHTKPTWKFEAYDGQTTYNNSLYVLTRFKVKEDGETLGDISVSYFGRHYKIIVTNERIDAKRERGRGYKTEDASKALLAVRKHFYRLAHSERISKAYEAAQQALYHESNSRGYDTRRAQADLFAHASDFVANNMGAYLAQYPAVAQYFDKFNATQEYEKVVDNVKGEFDNGTALLVVLDSGQYHVSIGIGTDRQSKVYTNDTLPQHMREKVGLLKLVQDGQTVSNAGFRLDANVFVVLPDKGEGENT